MILDAPSLHYHVSWRLDELQLSIFLSLLSILAIFNLTKPFITISHHQCKYLPSSGLLQLPHFHSCHILFCLHFHTDLKLTLWLYKSNWCLSTHYSQAITFTILLRYLRHFSSITSNQAFGTCYPYHPTSKSSIYSFPFKQRVCYYYYCCTIELW